VCTQPSTACAFGPLAPAGFKEMSFELPKKMKRSERLEMGETERKSREGEGTGFAYFSFCLKRFIHHFQERSNVV